MSVHLLLKFCGVWKKMIFFLCTVIPNLCIGVRIDWSIMGNCTFWQGWMRELALKVVVNTNSLGQSPALIK
jgi:hypothetical protein